MKGRKIDSSVALCLEEYSFWCEEEIKCEGVMLVKIVHRKKVNKYQNAMTIEQLITDEDEF